MSEIVSKWILYRLGIVVDTDPDTFAVKTSNGLLLAKILHSYELITADDLNLVRDSDQFKDCYKNFDLINLWLSYINLTVPIEDIYEIVHGIGSTSLHLFYQVFLELKNKSKLDFLTDNEINAQLNLRPHRFSVKKINEIEDMSNLDLNREGICEPFLAGGDVYHWYKDRIESLQNKCKEARDDYLHSVKNMRRPQNCETTPRSSARFISRSLSPKASAISLGEESDNLSDILNTKTYDELVNSQKEAQSLAPFKPDSNVTKAIMKNLHIKSKIRARNKVLKNQLHQEIMNEFDRKIDRSREKARYQVISNIFLKQSIYEKELISKLGQVKMQKEYMVDNKYKHGELLDKLKEKEFLELLLLKEKELNEKKLMYYFETERVIELHKKIWTERLRLRAKRHRDLCSQAVKDMVDISIRISEFKKRFGREPNRREMETFKRLFISGQPAFELCESLIDIIKVPDDDIPETIISGEMSRQNALDQEEFNAYVRYEWPWEIKNVEITSEIFQQIGFGLNILGYIVHRALEAKYPVVPLWEVPEFPECTTRVCINYLNETYIIPNLRNLLSSRDIKVIELQEGIDFCINAYKQESTTEYEYDPEPPVKDEKQKKRKLPNLKKGEKSISKKKKGTTETISELAEESNIEKSNKVSQTPIKFPCEEIVYSPKAVLGKTAQELLDDGEPLTDFLLTDMFVEYLKSIPNLKGWVLINYPTNYQQAVILEETFTGKKMMPPMSATNMSKILTEISEQDEKVDDSLYYVKRDSDLLPNPVPPPPVQLYDTILTAYISIKKLPHDKSGNATLPPSYEELGNEPDPLDRFYSNAGANYSMYYKDFDLPTIKYLAKLIIGDYSLPLKTSEELFGNIENLDKRPSKNVKATKKGEKVKKPKERMTFESTEQDHKKIVTAQKDKKGKTKVIIVFEDKGVQVPTEDEEEIEEIDVATSTSGVPCPGQPDWQYSDIKCPEELLVALATLWESLEEIYDNDLKQIFFLKRLSLNSIMPFAQFVKDVMRKIIDRPDYKSFFLAKFQKAFNNFEMDFRSDDEFKVEMSCRIEDFKEKLFEICDIKMMESENIRCQIIGADWTPREIRQLLNIFVNMFQIELDRCIETIRIINNYYMGIMTGVPSEDDNYREENIPKFREINKDIVNLMFQDSKSCVDLSYFDELLSGIIQKVNNCLRRMNSVTNVCIENTKVLYTTSQKSKSKASSPSSKTSKNTKTVDLNASIVKENYDKLLDEWQCAIKGEIYRVSLQVDLIKFNALQCIEEFLTSVQEAFHQVYKDIYTTYRDELQNIEMACNVFRVAVENERLVQKELIFEGHKFRINSEVNLFDNPPIIPELPREVVEEGAFTIEQLSKLSDILMNLSKSGYMPRTMFMFILQDITWVDPVDGFDWLTPKLWRKLDGQGLTKVVNSLFDDLEYVYWRDFIIYNIRIDFPSERDLQLTRKAFRECDPDGTELVQNYQFFSIKLWFEYLYTQESTKRIMDIKHLLFKLYNVQNYGLNYTAMLLDFCKDNSSLEGFAKALELSVGKLICWDTELGKIFEEEYLRRMKEHDDEVERRNLERDKLYQATYEELSKFVDHVCHITDDVVIEDLERSTEPTSTKGSILKKPTEGESTRRISKGEDLKFSEIVTMLKDNNERNNTSSEESVKLDPELRQTNGEDSESQIVKLYTDQPDNVGTETNDWAEIIFFLPMDIVVTVITAALPWHSRVKNYGDLSYWEHATQIFEESRNPHFNMSVLSHQFLNCENFVALLAQTKKFKIIDPVKVIAEIIHGSEDSANETI